MSRNFAAQSGGFASQRAQYRRTTSASSSTERLLPRLVHTSYPADNPPALSRFKRFKKSIQGTVKTYKNAAKGKINSIKTKTVNVVPI